MRPTRRSESCIVAACLLALGCAPAQPAPGKTEPRLVARAPTESEEWASLEDALRDLPFLKEHHYSVALPKHPAVEALRERATPATDEEKQALRTLLAREIFDPRAYDAALRRIPSDDPRLAEVFRKFDEWHRLWGFDAKPAYTVQLTLYGPGGEYYPQRATVRLLTDRTGWFKRHPDPLFTTLHEMVHIGIEGPLVKRFNLGHWEKERLADLITAHAFGALLPGYEVCKEGPREFDALVTDQTLQDLPAAFAPWADAQAAAARALADKAAAEGVPRIVRFSPADGARDVATSTAQIEVEFDMDMDDTARLCVRTPCGDSGICHKAMSWKSPRVLAIAADRALSPRREYRLSIGIAGCELQGANGKPMPPRTWTFATK